MQLSPDTQATLLLCCCLDHKGGDPKPLTLGQYNCLAGWLRQEGLRPGDLLRREGSERLLASVGLVDAEAVRQLLQRGGLLAIMVERWTQQGVWVVSRGESAYPQRLKSRMGAAAPPLLFGVGALPLLYRGGLAVVGSREADQDALLFTRRIATVCVREGVQVLSGGAKGVDLEAMKTAMNAGGTVIGVLPDTLGAESRSGKYLKFIKEGLLTLISPYHPDTRFSVGNAMGRNRLVYLLAEWALAVSASAVGEGGTWQGASDNLKKGWVPLIVRDGESLPKGNQELLARGAKPLGKALFDDHFSLRNWIGTFVLDSGLRGEKVPESGVPPASVEPSEVESGDFWQTVVWPRLQAILRVETDAVALAEKLCIEPMQANAWLKRAVEENGVKKLIRPVRYILASEWGKQGSLHF